MKDNFDSSQKTKTSKKVSAINGEVVGCEKLNVREEPVLSSKVLEIVSFGDQLQIDSNFYDEKFYRVKIKSGIYGYAIKDYVKMN